MTKDEHSVTVATVVFNGRSSIARTIESVLMQDYPRLEYLIIDGGSTDGTMDAIRTYENRVARIVCERDNGVYDAMNKAVRLARGDYILFMNCGDEFASPTSLSDAIDMIDGPEERVVFGRWVRRVKGREDRLCDPSLEQGLFNHQATLYSLSIHRWHGDFVDVKGLTTADYLFFATLMFSRPRICRTVPTTIAIIDADGLSAGLQTLAQKTAIDFLCGRTSRNRLALVSLLHPLYYRLKCLLRLRR